MAFTWRSLSAGDSIENEDFNEIKTNMDTIYTSMGISRPGCTGPGWTLLPVSDGGAITSAQMQQIRDVIDYADTNSCPANNGAYNTYVYSGQNAIVDSSYNGYVDGSDMATYCSTHRATVWSSYNTGVKWTYNYID